MIKIGVVGITGRMGGELIKATEENKDGEIICGYGDGLGFESEIELCDDLEEVFRKSDLVIDFSSPELFERCIEINEEYRKAFISGTTGISEKIMQRAKNLGEIAKVCISWNMSEGIAIMRRLLKEAVYALPESDIEILETHHNQKKDAPSGTALLLADEIAKTRRVDLNNVISIDRNKKRTNGEIGIAVRRGGGIIGEHSVSFFFGEETIEIKHTAFSRSIFAKGAIKAGVSLYRKIEECGYFDIIDLL